MERIDEYVTKINGDNENSNVSIMVPYDNGITIFDSNKILYHHVDGSYYFINENLDLSSNTYKDKKNELYYVNQMLDYNKPYITVKNGQIIENMVLKDNDGAVLVHKDLYPHIEDYNGMTINQLKDLFYVGSNEKLVVVNAQGEILKNIDFILPSDELSRKERIIGKILKLVNKLTDNKPYKKHFEINNCIMNYHNFVLFICSMLLDELLKSSFIIDDEMININDIGDEVLLVKLNGKEINMSLIDISFVNSKEYFVGLKPLYVEMYNLEKIKSLPIKNSDKELKHLTKVRLPLK